MAIAPKTVRTYSLNGSVRDFQIPFEYLARKFVQVTLIGSTRRVLSLNIDYRFSTTNQITTNRAWSVSDGFTDIEIRRFTSATDRLVNFADGSVLKAYDLNISQVQSLHIAEESRDLVADTISLNDANQLDARARRLTNLQDAVNDTDAVNLRMQKQWANTALNYSSAAGDSAGKAKVSEQNAAQSAVTAAQKASQWKAATDASPNPVTADVQTVINGISATGIVMWPAMNFTGVSEGALNVGSKGILNLINGATFNGGYPSALPGLTLGMVDKGLRLRRLRGAGPQDYADWVSQRDANYVGGTPGFVNSAQLCETTVRDGVKSFEWNRVDRLVNYASEGEHCARYVQALKMGVGATWGDVIEVRDMYGANPTQGLVGQEIDLFSNGTDNLGNRVGFDFVTGKARPEGAPGEWGHVMRFGPQNADLSLSTIKNIITVLGGVDCVMNLMGTGTRIIRDQGSRVVGIDLISAFYSEAAMRLNGNQKITWEGSGQIATYFDTTKGQFSFMNGSTQMMAISASAKALLDSAGNKVIGDQVKGWASPTGAGFSRAALDTSWSNTGSASYTASEIIKLNDQVALLTKTLAALIKDIKEKVGFLAT